MVPSSVSGPHQWVGGRGAASLSWSLIPMLQCLLPFICRHSGARLASQAAQKQQVIVQAGFLQHDWVVAVVRCHFFCHFRRWQLRSPLSRWTHQCELLSRMLSDDAYIGPFFQFHAAFPGPSIQPGSSHISMQTCSCRNAMLFASIHCSDNSMWRRISSRNFIALSVPSTIAFAGTPALAWRGMLKQRKRQAPLPSAAMTSNAGAGRLQGASGPDFTGVGK